MHPIRLRKGGSLQIVVLQEVLPFRVFVLLRQPVCAGVVVEEYVLDLSLVCRRHPAGVGKR